MSAAEDFAQFIAGMSPEFRRIAWQHWCANDLEWANALALSLPVGDKIAVIGMRRDIVIGLMIGEPTEGIEKPPEATTGTPSGGELAPNPVSGAASDCVLHDWYVPSFAEDGVPICSKCGRRSWPE